MIGEGGEAACRGSALSGFCNIERKGLAQLTENVLCDFGVVIKVRSLFCLLDEIAVHVISGVQGKITGFAFFIGEAGGDIHQQAQVVERIGSLAGGQTICGFNGFREHIAGFRIEGSHDKSVERQFALFPGDHGSVSFRGNSLHGKHRACSRHAHSRFAGPDRLENRDAGERRSQAAGFVIRILAENVAALVLYDTLSNNTVAVIRVVINILNVCAYLHDFLDGPVVGVIQRGDAFRVVRLRLGRHDTHVVIGIGNRCLITADVFDIAVAGVGVSCGLRGIGTNCLGGFCQQTGGWIVSVFNRCCSGRRSGFDFGDLPGGIESLYHLLRGAVGQNVIPVSHTASVSAIGDGRGLTGLDQAGIAVELLEAGRGTAVVQMEAGKVSRLTEVIDFPVIDVLDTFRCDAEGIAFCNDIAGQALSGGIRADGLRSGLEAADRTVLGDGHIPGNRGAEVISVLIKTLDEDGASGLVVLDADGLPDPVPGELPDLILDGLLGDFHNSGIQKVLDVGGLENLVERVEISGELQTLQWTEGLQRSGFIAPDKRIRIDGLQRRGENYASQSGEVHESMRGDLRDVALQDHSGGLVFQIGPGSGVLLAEGGHLTGAADDQGAGPLIVEIRKAGTNHLRGAAGGCRGSVGDCTGCIDFHGDHDRIEVDLVPLIGKLIPAVTVAPAVPVAPVAVLFTPVPLPVFLRGTGRGVQGSKADHHADDQENGQKDFHFFHLSLPLYYII